MDINPDDDIWFDFLQDIGINNPVEDNPVSNSSENIETNHTSDSNLEPPCKKRKQKSLHQASRTLQYSGMKAYELRTLLITDCYNFCRQYNLLASSAICYCGENMYLSPSKQTSDGYVWLCRRKNGHNNAVTIRKGSWFEYSKLNISEILWIAYMWVYEYSHTSMIHESGQSKRALQDWCKNCQNACQLILKHKTDPIGGPDKIVEIFEAKVKNSQNSKKKRCKDNFEQWVFCAIEQSSTKIICVTVPDKKSDTLFDIFDDYILEGSTIYCQIWNAYIDFDLDSFDYLTKEKKLTFHDCITKADIDTFEKFQHVAKKPRSGLNNCNYEYNAKFCEYVYRKTLYFAPDSYLAFLDDISLIYKLEGGIIRKDRPAPKTEKINSE